MSKAEEYRRLAAEARKRAAESENPTTKAMYEQLARNWDDLAAEAAHGSNGLIPKPSAGHRGQ